MVFCRLEEKTNKTGKQYSDLLLDKYLIFNFFKYRIAYLNLIYIYFDFIETIN